LPALAAAAGHALKSSSSRESGAGLQSVVARGFRDHDAVQRRSLGALFALLALALAGIAFESARGAGASAGRWIVAVAAAAIAVWLGSMAWRALR
jgi:hypothetical protein